jgi:diaminohydroxyphosphoribosylaminopyrimidine deaminase/5-amino-6-(5-phosphoribosylamino)uracil reductase
MIGYNTARYDNPRLNVRDWHGRNPVRVVMDRDLELDAHLNIFDGSQTTIVFNSKSEMQKNNIIYVKRSGENPLPQMLGYLSERGIQSVLVEGGADTHRAFIDAGLWDEARIIVSETIFNEGIPAAFLKDKEMIHQRDIPPDHIYIYRNIKG